MKLDIFKQSETTDTTSKSSFNPDKRNLDTENVEQKQDTKINLFNPDKRVDSSNIEKMVKSYVKELKVYSDLPKTLKDLKINVSEFVKTPTEVVKELKQDFSDHKEAYIKEWENIHNMEWPRYEEDVYIKLKSTGEMKMIRKAGDRYDAHHIIPLSLGGKNSGYNLTPLRADKHMDSRGIHSEKGVLAKIEKNLGGN